MDQTPDRSTFLTLASLVEGGLVVVALGVGWVFNVQPLETVTWDVDALLWGIGGAIPLYAGFVICDRYPVGPLRPIKELLVDILGPLLARCSKWDLAAIALLAGIGEETLFRGLLLPLFGGDSFWLGLLISSVLFGLAHSVTMTYVVLATVAGLYFGLQLHYSGNLLAPIITHALYDYLAFVKVAAESRERHNANQHTEANKNFE